MKMGEAEIWLRNELSTIYDENEAINISAMLLEKITGLSASERAVGKEEPLVVSQLHQLTEMHHRSMQHEPVQYILGEVYFHGLKLYVNNTVLIPRPETEELVEWVIHDVKKKGLPVFEKNIPEADETTKLKILDVGTGSGCIALALKYKMPKAEVWGCDVSDEVLNIARRNGSELNIRVDFQGINFLDEMQQKSLPTVDIIVSNPPYIPMKEKDSLHANVLHHEPHLALFVADDDPLVFYRAIAACGKKRLYTSGAIYVETHENTAQAIAELFKNEGYVNVEIRKDMQGKERMVKALKA
jgi:release factor glutamine methyltransferase